MEMGWIGDGVLLPCLLTLVKEQATFATGKLKVNFFFFFVWNVSRSPGEI